MGSACEMERCGVCVRGRGGRMCEGEVGSVCERERERWGVSVRWRGGECV